MPVRALMPVRFASAGDIYSELAAKRLLGQQYSFRLHAWRKRMWNADIAYNDLPCCLRTRILCQARLHEGETYRHPGLYAGVVDSASISIQPARNVCRHNGQTTSIRRSDQISVHASRRPLCSSPEQRIYNPCNATIEQTGQMDCCNSPMNIHIIICSCI
ncbi:hypothetical protein D3C78_1150260 [compost metagenome]